MSLASVTSSPMSVFESHANGLETPLSSASSIADDKEFKRRKLERPPSPDHVDTRAPVFLKMSFKRGPEVDEPDTRIEDDETYNARPWQERSTIVPVLVAFRERFSDVLQGTPEMGPQDFEEGVESESPSQEVQEFICGLLTLILNRAKPVEYPNYNRSLSDCVLSYHATKGDPIWEGANPLAGNRRFPDLTTDDRLRLLQCLMEWSLTESKILRDKIEEAYRNRTAQRIQSHNPYELSIIGRDDQKHGYYLIKGVNTRFRLYIQTDLTKVPSRWYSICSTLEELRALTSKLSDAARTVRCRKIVDDLASIHIPEVERAEEVRRVAMVKRQRALHDRQRRAVYASELADQIVERGSRTRGRRVNYNSMLQGQGEDQDGNPLSRWSSRQATPESLTPPASRSGRMIKRPRLWEEESPSSEIQRAAADQSTQSESGVNFVEIPEDSPESLIVILKYSKDKFHRWVRRPWSSTQIQPETSYQKRQKEIEALVVPQPLSEEQQSLVKIYGPVIAAQMATNQTRNTTSEPSIPAQPQGGRNAAAAPDEGNTRPSDNGAVGFGRNDESLISGASRDNHTDTREDGKCLLLATIRSNHDKLDYLNGLVQATIETATRHKVKDLVVQLSGTPELAAQWSSCNTEAFIAIQKIISNVYLSIARYGQILNANVEPVVIFKDWCGYELAVEDITWKSISVVSADTESLEEFLTRHTTHFANRERPEIIRADDQIPEIPHNSRDRPEASRHFDIVAVGGTFDHLHAGHKILLTLTAWLAHQKVVCGVTDDALLVNKKHKEVMQNLPERTRGVQEFCNWVKRGIEYQMVSINDVAGPTGSDASIQALVASRETEAGSAQIKQIRLDRGLPALEILFIDVIGPDGTVDGEQMAELKLSSTAIRQKLASKM